MENISDIVMVSALINPGCLLIESAIVIVSACGIDIAFTMVSAIVIESALPKPIAFVFRVSAIAIVSLSISPGSFEIASTMAIVSAIANAWSL